MSQDALELLLNGVKDPGQRKQITSAYYAFANGDPETFAVQFAVLLRAHAASLKLLPARLEKTSQRKPASSATSSSHIKMRSGE
jgi:hypothetical protein